MSDLFIADERVAFAIQGIRAIIKETDIIATNSDVRYLYSIRVEYEGLTESVEYGYDLESRDAIFDALVDAMPVKRVKKTKEDGDGNQNSA